MTFAFYFDDELVQALRRGERVSVSYNDPMFIGYGRDAQRVTEGTIVGIQSRARNNSDNTIDVHVLCVGVSREQRGKGRTRVHYTYTYMFEEAA